MGGPDIDWKGGRTDYVDDSKLPPQGRLPDGAQGSDHLRHVFYRMGFSDQEIVALSGAHNLGRCHSDRSYVPNKLGYPRKLLNVNLVASKEHGSTVQPDLATSTITCYDP